MQKSTYMAKECGVERQVAWSHVSKSPSLHVSRSSRCRRGLAPLELVFALPLLLMMMALMVNYGVIASWKVRGLSVARFEALRERHESQDFMAGGYAYPRDGSWWPDTATYGHESSNLSIAEAAAIDSTGLVPSKGDLTIVATLLDANRGLESGHGDLTRRYAMLGKLGMYDLSAKAYFLDGKWRFNEMGLDRNYSRRYWVIYNPPPTIMSDMAAENYAKVATEIYYTFYAAFSPYGESLSPLDNDAEYIAFEGSAPDFHPSLRGFCSLEKSSVDVLAQNLIDRIKGTDDTPGLAERMTKAFISLYQKTIRDYQSRLDAGAGDTTPPINIDDLNRKIATLEAFLAKLQSKKSKH